MTTPKNPKPNRPAAEKRTKNTLPSNVKAFIVSRFAMWNTRNEIKALVKQEFDLDVTDSQLRCYNGDAQGDPAHTMGEDLMKLFHKVRQQYVEELSKHPIAHRGFRIQKLGEMFEKSMERGNFRQAQSLLEQAAKEAGDQFTNTLKVKASQPSDADAADLTPEERVNVLTDKLAAAFRQMKAEPGAKAH